jgi:hypothetical protein
MRLLLSYGVEPVPAYLELFSKQNGVCDEKALCSLF